jgi:hypothetical protein
MDAEYLALTYVDTSRAFIAFPNIYITAKPRL